MSEHTTSPVLRTETSTSLNTAVYPPITQTPAADDEPAALMKSQPLRNVGVCFSGGGSRALSAAMGQYRGLHHARDRQGNRFIDRVGTISSVSGGSWASAIYTYTPESVASYDDMLGGVAAPASLTWSGSGPGALDDLNANSMGQAAVRVGLLQLYHVYKDLKEKGFSDWHQLWRAMMGELILKDYGLYTTDSDFNPTTYYAWKKDWFNDHILPHNPSLNASSFHFARNDWPWLTMNTALVYNQKPEQLVPMLCSTFYAGLNGSFPQPGQGGPTVGGGYIQPFAFGSSFGGIPQANRADVNSPRPFSLSDIVSLSSAAFAAEFVKWAKDLDRKALGLSGPEHDAAFAQLDSLGLDDVVPQYDYFPAENGGSTGGTYYFADGGSLENNGVADILATTRLEKIVVFVNAMEPVKNNWETFDNTQVPGAIPPLFGYQPIHGFLDDSGYQPYGAGGEVTDPLMAHNQVFDGTRFNELLDGLKSAAGDYQNTAMYLQKDLPVVDNSWFGVEGNRTVDVLWVCNNRVKTWEQQITDRKIQDKLAERDLPLTALWNFPWYDTVAQLHLSEQQVNMLAHLSCWNVMADENAAVWAQIFD